MSILDLEEEFSKKYAALSNDLNRLFDDVTVQSGMDLAGHEISKAVMIRLRAYYEHQNATKSLLHKRYAASAADFFVETVLFYLAAAFKMYNVPLEVHSERQIRRKRGAIRPDISIWKGDEVISIIECKTQLGRSRNDWEKSFAARELILKREFPNASAFLMVMTAANWAGFGEDERVGKTYFCLSKVWPTAVRTEHWEECLLNPIEPIVKSFIEKHKG